MGLFDTVIGGLRGAYNWAQEKIFGKKPEQVPGAPPTVSEEEEMNRIAEEKAATERRLAEEEQARRQEAERREFEEREKLMYTYEEGPKKRYMVQVQLQWVCFNSYGEVVKRYFEDTTPKGVVVSATSPEEATLIAGSMNANFWGPNLTRTGQSPDEYARQQWMMLPDMRRRAYNQNEGTDEIVKPSGCFVGGHVEVSADTIEEDSARRINELKSKKLKSPSQTRLGG